MIISKSKNINEEIELATTKAISNAGERVENKNNEKK